MSLHELIDSYAMTMIDQWTIIVYYKKSLSSIIYK